MTASQGRSDFWIGRDRRTSLAVLMLSVFAATSLMSVSGVAADGDVEPPADSQAPAPDESSGESDAPVESPSDEEASSSNDEELATAGACDGSLTPVGSTYSVTGKIIADWNFSNPVGGATVKLVHPQDWNLFLCTTSHSTTGAFSLSVPSNWPAASGNSPYTLDVVAPPSAALLDSSLWVTSLTEGSILNTSLASGLCPGGGGVTNASGDRTLTGTVTAEGTAVANVAVRVAGFASLAFACTVSNAQGQYSLKVPNNWTNTSGHTIVFNPPASRMDIGSHMTVITEDGVRDAQLKAPAVRGTITARNDGTSLFPTAFEANVCLYVTVGAQMPIGCGGGRVSNSAEVVYAVSTTSAFAVVATHFRVFATSPDGMPMQWPAQGVNQPIVSYAPDSQNVTIDFQAYERPACSNGASPNVTGTVTSGGVGTSTKVRLLASGYSTLTGWASDEIGYATTSAANGTFGFCVNWSQLNWANWVQVVADASSSSRKSGSPSTGDSASVALRKTECSTSCVMNVVMGAPTVFGRIAYADSVIIEKESSSGGSDTFAEVTTSDGYFAANLPFEQGSSYRITGFTGTAELAPYSTVSAFTGATINVGDRSMQEPNLRGTVLKTDGSTYPSYESGVKVEITSVPGGGAQGVPQAVGLPGGGRFAAKVANGTYNVKVSGWQIPTTEGQIVVSNGAITQKPADWVMGVGGRLFVQLSSGAIKIKPVKMDGSAVTTSVMVQVSKWNGQWFDWTSDQPVSVGDGVYGWSPSSAGDYEIRIVPSDSTSGLSQTSHYVRVSGTGSQATISKSCTYSPGQDPPNCSQNPPTQDAGSNFPFSVKGANFVAKVCAPQVEGVTCPPLSQNEWERANAQISRLESNGFDDFFAQIANTQVTGNDLAIRLEEPSSGSTIYKITFEPPYGNPNGWAAFDVYLKLTKPQSGAVTWSRCADKSCSSGLTSLQVNSSGAFSYGQNLYFAAAKIKGTVRKPDNNPVASSWIQVQKIVDDGFGSTRMQWVGGTNTSQTGAFSLTLEPGLYELKANPPWDDQSGSLSDGVLMVSVSAQGYPVDNSGQTIENLVISLRSPNITGVVKAGTSPRAWVGVNVEKWDVNRQQFDWQPIWSNTDRDGEFRLFLANGKWRLNAYPQGADGGLYTAGKVVIDVAGGALTHVNSQTVSANTVVDLSFGTPNVSGVVKMPNGNGVQWAGVGIDRWDSERGFFQWFTWTNTTNTGAYAVELEPGTYQLSAEPPQNASGATRTKKILLVPASGSSCFVPTPETASCDGLSSNLDITLSGPNVEGVVSGNGSPKAAWVFVETWNGSWFEWGNNWDDARETDGAFGFRLTDGLHKVSAEPRSGGGFAKGESFIKVVGDFWCATTQQAIQSNNATCTPTNSASLGVAMPGSNLTGQARYQQGGSWANLQDGWVEIFELSENGEIAGWMGNAGLNYNGQFSTRLLGSSAEVTRVRVIVSPSPWNNPNNLGKKRIDYWLADFDNDGVKDDLCKQAPTTGACAVPVTGTQQFDLSGGNVTGVLQRPTNPVSAAGDSEITVEKKRTEGSFSWFQWTDNFARTNYSGAFSLSLEPGVYKVTGRPPWGSSTHSPVAQVITVVSDSLWCLGDVPNCAGVSAGSSLALTLKTPNVSARVLRASNCGGNGQPSCSVRDAWVGIEKEVFVDPDGAGPNQGWTYWEWTGNATPSSNDGSFALNVTEDGTYRVSVNPPWNDATGLVRFTREFVVSGSGANVVWSTPLGANNSMTFPGANVTFTVRNSSDQSVRDAWVFVEKQITFDPDGTGPLPSQSYWEWADSSGASNANGLVSMYVPGNGSSSVEYRVVVNPPWNDNTLPRFTDQFTVAADGTVTGLDSVLRFPSANVSGKIWLKKATTPNQANSFGYVRVENANGQTVAETSANGTGSFSLFVADGSYSVWFYPNYGLASYLPLEAKITVSAGVLTSWRYASDGPELNRCGGGQSCDFSASFDNVTPNLTVTVSVSPTNSAAAGAFVRLTDLSTNKTFDFVTGDDGTFSVAVPAATYKIDAVWLIGGVTRIGGKASQVVGSGTGANRTQVTVSVSASP